MRELDKESPHYRDIVEIESATQRCKEIVDRLLDLQGQGCYKSKEPIPISEVVATAMRFIVSKREKMRSRYEWENEQGETSGDRRRFIQVFKPVQNTFECLKVGQLCQKKVKEVKIFMI